MPATRRRSGGIFRRRQRLRQCRQRQPRCCIDLAQHVLAVGHGPTSIQSVQSEQAANGSSTNQDTSPRKTFVSSNRPGPRTIRQRARRSMARLDRQNRLRRLGRSQLGTGPGPRRRRCRRQGLCRGARRQGPQPRARNPLDLRPLAGPGPGRRTERQNVAVPRGRVGRGLCQVARGRQQSSPHRSVLRPRPTSPRSPTSKPPGRCKTSCGWPTSSASCKTGSIPVSGFVGSPAHCWSHWFLFPPLPKSLGGHRDSRRLSSQLRTAGRTFLPRSSRPA